MSTVFANIIGAVVTALTNAPAVSPQIWRARSRPMASQHSTAVVVRVQDSTPERNALKGAPFDLQTRIAVECYARTSSNSTSADLAGDTLLAAVYARLMADTTLGGLVADLQLEQLSYDFDADAEQTVCITLILLVSHRVASASIE